MSGNYGTISCEEPSPEEFVKEEFMLHDYCGNGKGIFSNKLVNSVNSLGEHIGLTHEGEPAPFKTKYEEEECEVKPFEAIFFKEGEEDIGVSHSNDSDPLAIKKEERIENEVGFQIKQEMSSCSEDFHQSFSNWHRQADVFIS